MKPALVCLHGWGGSKESFTELRQALEGIDITIYTPDLPGFGNQADPTKPYTNDNYADWVTDWIASTVQEDTIFLLGHSHGGRISIKLATRQSNGDHSLPKIEHLYLCAAAGIRHPRHIKRTIGLVLAKSGKTILNAPGLKKLEPIAKKVLYKLVRVHDYEKASEVMRKTLINVSKEDLRPILSDIKQPTDIFWGTDDGMTPYSDALLMKEHIKNSTLHTYEKTRHAVHRVQAADIASAIAEDLLSL